ncbi:hypothetical protein T03_3491 [Trichinella britovi]|uniref:Uncharacterized protein n=1 Tax=Trichinella britovi TaxID=45882 RepID=A0A0V1CUQ0_TRIBR|nr:hypothetical protein T03_3491 [Trichinella britovi]
MADISFEQLEDPRRSTVTIGHVASLCAWVIVVPDRSSSDLLRRLLIPRCNKRSERLSGVCFVTQSLQIAWSLLSSTWRAAPPAIERTPETFASCLLQGKWAAVRGLLTDERTKITHHHPKFGLDAEMDSVITNTGVSEKKLYTILDATQVIRIDEHAEGCRVDAHAFYHQQQLNELKRLAAGNPRPISEIYDELASGASTSLGCWLRVTAGAGMGRIRLSAAGTTSCLRFLRLLHSKAEIVVEVDLALILPLLPSCASAGRPA